MTEDKNSYEKAYDSGVSFALLRELSEMVYGIARTAELNHPANNLQIQKEAETVLRIIDSFLLSSRAQFGQISLDFSTVGVGSVLQDCAEDIRFVTNNRVDVEVNTVGTVMAHKLLLKNFIFSLGYYISKTNVKRLSFKAYKQPDNRIGISVLSPEFQISKHQLRQALKYNTAHMSMPKLTTQGSIMLVVADAIAKALGAELRVVKQGKSKGFCIDLYKSEQLSLV